MKCKVLNALLRDSLAAMLSWQCCRDINCTIFEQAQGGKLSELILLSEPSCAKSKMFGFSIKPCCILFSTVLIGYGCAPISFSSSRRGITLPLVPLFPWPFPNSKSAESSKISWEQVGCNGCGNPEEPLQCSMEKCWWTAPQLMPPAQRACSGTEDPQGGGVRKMNSSECCGAQQYLKPRYQVLRVVTKC